TNNQPIPQIRRESWHLFQQGSQAGIEYMTNHLSLAKSENSNFNFEIKVWEAGRDHSNLGYKEC
uniref:hypothetical protein n=1 Tax=Psychroserpens mesophilus TaxID=325473 RepID=UPI003D65CCB2